MSKLIRLRDEIKALEREGLVTVADGMMTIVRDEDAVRDRIMQTGPWGALLLVGGLEAAMREIYGGRRQCG